METFDTLVSGFFIAASVAIIGAAYGSYINNKYDRERGRTEKTLEFINEFYSKEFAHCKESLWWTKEAVLDNKVSIKYIAKAFIYPLKEGYYYNGKHVPEDGGLLEIQHLFVYFGFLQRLGLSIEKEYVNKNEIKAGLCNMMLWNGELITKICDSIEDMATERELYYIKNEKEIHYIKHIRKVYETLDLSSISEVYGHEIPYSCIELKQSEKQD